MPLLRPLLALACCLLLTACQDASTTEDLGTRRVALPNGQTIRAEVATDSFEMSRGLMFRDSLPENRGMLFYHQQPGRYTFWMYQVKIPLDIIWLDANKRIVEISANTPPCEKGPASECPKYGGNVDAQYVLELAAGVAAKHGLRVGDRLDF